MKAAVLLQKCTTNKKTFGIRIEEREDGEWYKTWTFPIDEARAIRENFHNTRVVSFLPEGEGYPGCPYCGAKTAFYDTNCGGKLTCYHGESVITCQWCNTTYDDHAPSQDKLTYTGGDY